MISFAVISAYSMMMVSNISQYKYRELKNDKAVIENISAYTNKEFLSSLEIADAKIENLLNSFNSVEEPFKVRQYLNENKEMFDLLYDATSHFKEAFASDTMFSISLLDNSEEDETTQIYISAESAADIDILFNQLDIFYRSWWIKQIHKSKGKIVFGIC